MNKSVRDCRLPSVGMKRRRKSHLYIFTLVNVLHRPEVVDIGVKTYIEKHVICLKDYRIRPLLSIQYVHGNLCKHLGIDSSTDHPYINRHGHA